MKRITVNVPEEFHRAVKIRAAALGKTVSEVMRELIAQWLEKGRENEDNGRSKDVHNGDGTGDLEAHHGV